MDGLGKRKIKSFLQLDTGFLVKVSYFGVSIRVSIWHINRPLSLSTWGFNSDDSE